MANYCTNCGKEIAEGVAFCTECGTPAPKDAPQQTPAAPETANAQAEAAPANTPTCKNCGTPLKDGVAFCTECGTPRNGEPVSEPVKTAAPPPPPPTYTPPVQSNTPPVQTTAAPEPASKVVSTGAFFGLQFLFAIPVIGWLACIIMAFAPKNKNIKHYARAMLIWLIIGLVVAVALFFLFKWIGGVLMDYINQATDGAFGDWGEFFEQFKEIGDMKDQLPGGFSSLPIE